MAGAGLLLYAWLRPPFPRRHLGHFLAFALVGLAAVQYTYLAAIANSNVATAIFLQYSSVPMIAAYELIRKRLRLTPPRVLALAAAMLGIALLVLGGPGGALALHVTLLGLVFGVLAAVTAAFYTLSSVRLVQDLGAWPTITWGFLVGVVPLLVWAPPWSTRLTGSGLEVALLVAFVVIPGTLIPFGLFLASLEHISATEAAIAVSAEPVTAAGVALLFLRVALLPLQYVGGGLIVLAVIMLRRGTAPEAPVYPDQPRAPGTDDVS
jgi:drug/metabolite transporter (DMT)-like permease